MSHPPPPPGGRTRRHASIVSSRPDDDDDSYSPQTPSSNTGRPQHGHGGASGGAGIAAAADAHLNQLMSIFCAPAAFTHCGDDVAHVRSIIDYRICNPNLSEPLYQHLTDLCLQYTERFAKRMQILEKRGGERDASDTSTIITHWSLSLRAVLERPFSSRMAFAVYIMISLIVLSSCVSVVMQTVPKYNPDLKTQYGKSWDNVELSLSLILLFEWLLRLLSYMADPTVTGLVPRLRKFLNGPAFLDLLASFLPLLSAVSGFPNGFINVLALLRLLRIFFALRHFDAFEDLLDTIQSSLSSLLGPFVGLFVVIVFMSSLLFTLESGAFQAQSKKFLVRNEDCEMTAAYIMGAIQCPRLESRFVSIPDSMWFSLITVLTVGYGDMVPLTSAGRLLTVALIISGILFTAMPIAIVGTNFTLTVERLKHERKCVVETMARRKEMSRLFEDVNRVEVMMTQPPATPAGALVRFLRVNLCLTHLKLRTATRRVAYFIDLYMSRVVDCFMDLEHRQTLLQIAQRCKQPPRVFACRLALLSPATGMGDPATTYSPDTDSSSFASVPILKLPLSRPLMISLGSSPLADVSLFSSAWRRHAVAEFRHKLQHYISMVRDGSSGNLASMSPRLLRAQHALLSTSSIPGSEKPTYAQSVCVWDATEFLASHQCDIAVSSFGADVQRLSLENVGSAYTALIDPSTGRDIAYTTVNDAYIVLSNQHARALAPVAAGSPSGSPAASPRSAMMAATAPQSKLFYDPAEVKLKVHFGVPFSILPNVVYLADERKDALSKSFAAALNPTDPRHRGFSSATSRKFSVTF